MKVWETVVASCMEGIYEACNMVAVVLGFHQFCLELEDKALPLDNMVVLFLPNMVE